MPIRRFVIPRPWHRVAAWAAVGLVVAAVWAGLDGGDPAGRGAREDLGPPGHNCRFWALVGQGYPPGLLDEQLRRDGHTTLQSLGEYNRDGWGFVSYPSDTTMRRLLLAPLARRGRPAADQPADPNFSVAVDELMRGRPRAVLGHVRTGTSGHWGIPDPHPFVQRGLAFAHNGGVSITVIEELIDAELPGFLDDNPPEYVRGNVDSEILFLWLLCHAEAHPELPFTEAVREAVELLYDRVAPARLNFIMTRGDTLWALRCSGSDTPDPVRYYPNDAPASPFWIVASQPVGAEGGRWAAIPPASLGVFVPGQPPAFYPVQTDGTATFRFRDIRVTPGEDRDGDGHAVDFTVRSDPEADFGRHAVSVRVLELTEDATRFLAASDTVEIVAGSIDAIEVAIRVEPAGLLPAVWNLQVELLSLDDPTLPVTVAAAGPGSDPAWGLANLRVEGTEHDVPMPPPPPATDRIGRPYPNPARGTVEIPVTLATHDGVVALEIWDASGRRCYVDPTSPVVALQGGSPEARSGVRWDGRDRNGRALPAGVYLARVRAGSATAEARITLLR